MKVLQHKIAFITGSTRGIGLAIALDFAKNGATVILHGSKKTPHAIQALAQVKRIAPESSICFFDISKQTEVKRECSMLVKLYPRIDILVNNAGVLSNALFSKMTYQQWDRVIKTNLYGVFYVTHVILPSMISNKYGRIINMSSIAAIIGDWGMTNYSASKAAILGFTKSLAKEVARYAITVNAVCPGLVDTSMMGNVPTEYVAKMLEKIPLKRKANPEEIAQLVTFIASENARYITSEAMNINGGWI